MARTEDARTVHALRVYNPDDDTEWVDIAIIDEIHFIAEADQFWDYQYNFANPTNGANVQNIRKVRGKKIVGSDGDSYIVAERIDSNQYVYVEEHYWVNEWEMTGNAEKNEPEPKHYNTHLVKITGYSGLGPTDNRNDDYKDTSIWVVMQRMDVVANIQQEEQYWEGHYELQWKGSPEPGKPPPPDSNGFLNGDTQDKGDGTGEAPDNDDPGSPVDTSYDPNLWTGGNQQPPYRFDPFQNPVDVNWGGLAVEFYPQDL